LKAATSTFTPHKRQNPRGVRRNSWVFARVTTQLMKASADQSISNVAFCGRRQSASPGLGIAEEPQARLRRGEVGAGTRCRRGTVHSLVVLCIDFPLLAALGPRACRRSRLIVSVMESIDKIRGGLLSEPLCLRPPGR
jgi:hypothetical protein